MHLRCIYRNNTATLIGGWLQRGQKWCSEMKIQWDWKGNGWKPYAGSPDGNSRGVLLIGPGNSEWNYWNLCCDCEASVTLAPIPPELIGCTVELARSSGEDEQRLAIPEHCERALLDRRNRSHMVADPIVQRCSPRGSISALEHTERRSPTVPERKDSEQGGFKIEV